MANWLLEDHNQKCFYSEIRSAGPSAFQLLCWKVTFQFSSFLLLVHTR